MMQLINTINVVSLCQMLAGAIIISISILLCARSGSQHLKKHHVKWMVTVCLILLGAYSLLIMLWAKKMLPAETLIGGFALVCSCLIALLAALHKSATNRLRTEVAEHTISKQNISDLSLTDQPTHLYNRRGFISIVEKHLIRLKRLKKKAVLCFIKLQNLQMINEKSGYKEGDKVLANVGTLMVSTFRQADVLARIGDDEFIAFLVDADTGDMEAINHNFQKNLRKYNEKRAAGFKLSLRFAVSGFDPERSESAYDMISQASASVRQKKKPHTSKRPARSKNNTTNFTLIVSNMCATSRPIELMIYIDGAPAVNDTFDTGMQNTWKPFYFSLARGRHTITVKSAKGRTGLTQEFEIRKDHWASIEYRSDSAASTGTRSLSGKLSFHMHDVPPVHSFVRPVKK